MKTRLLLGLAVAVAAVIYLIASSLFVVREG